LRFPAAAFPCLAQQSVHYSSSRARPLDFMFLSTPSLRMRFSPRHPFCVSIAPVFAWFWRCNGFRSPFLPSARLFSYCHSPSCPSLGWRFLSLHLFFFPFLGLVFLLATSDSSISGDELFFSCFSPCARCRIFYSFFYPGTSPKYFRIRFFVNDILLRSVNAKCACPGAHPLEYGSYRNSPSTFYLPPLFPEDYSFFDTLLGVFVCSLYLVVSLPLPGLPRQAEVVFFLFML